jgi:uncharacterized membrane protein
MYNPLGTIRSWISNTLVSQMSSRINGEYTLGYNVIIAYDLVYGLTDEQYEQAVNELIDTYTTGILSTVTMIICASLIAIASSIHTHAYHDLCLESYRIYHKLSE